MANGFYPRTRMNEFSFEKMPRFRRILGNIKKAKNKDEIILNILKQREQKLNSLNENKINLSKEISPIGKQVLFEFKLEQLQFLVALYLRDKYIERVGKEKEEDKKTGEFWRGVKTQRRKLQLSEVVKKFQTAFSEKEIESRDNRVREVYEILGSSQRGLLEMDPKQLDEMGRKWEKEKEKLEEGREKTPIQKAIEKKESELWAKEFAKKKSWAEQERQRQIKEQSKGMGRYVILILLAIISLYFLFLQ